MHPKTKRYIVVLIVALVIIITFVVLGYNIIGPMLCQWPCEWIWTWGTGFCDCTPGIPTPPETTGLPEGIPGFPWEATLLGILVVLIFIYIIRRRNQ